MPRTENTIQVGYKTVEVLEDDQSVLVNDKRVESLQDLEEAVHILATAMIKLVRG